MIPPNNLKKLAEFVREWSETIVNNSNYGYCTETLQGFCAIAAFKMQEVYLLNHKNEFDLIISHNNSHCFNIFNGKYIIDVTATQFDYDKIAFKAIKEIDLKTNDHWIIKHKFKTLNRFVNHLKTDGWPYEQIPGETMMNELENLVICY